MSGLTDRITQVLRLHGDHDTRANAEYLAQRVAVELQLTEETAFQFTHNATGRSTILDLVDLEQARAIERRDKLHTLAVVRRWVSGWAAVEGFGEAP